jgi:hypothetical protein
VTLELVILKIFTWIMLLGTFDWPKKSPSSTFYKFFCLVPHTKSFSAMQCNRHFMPPVNFQDHFEHDKGKTCEILWGWGLLWTNYCIQIFFHKFIFILTRVQVSHCHKGHFLCVWNYLDRKECRWDEITYLFLMSLGIQIGFNYNNNN